MHYSYIDLTYLRNFSQGNQNFVHEILTVALEQTGSELLALSNALARNDSLQIGRICHKLRSSLGFLGVRPSLIEQLKENERQALSERADLKVIVEAIVRLCSQVNAELEKARDELPTNSSPG